MLIKVKITLNKGVNVKRGGRYMGSWKGGREEKCRVGIVVVGRVEERRSVG